MRSVFFTAIELTCLIESISTNNPRIEWKKIKNGVPSYVYFQNRIAGKQLGNSLFTKSCQPVRAQLFQRGLKAELNECCLERTWPWILSWTVKSRCVCEWAIVKCFFCPPSLKRGLGAPGSAQGAGQHPDLQHHPVRHCRVSLRGGRHRWSKGLWWDTH